MCLELIAAYRERMQREEKNYQKTVSETVNQANTEVNRIDRQWNEDEIIINSNIRGVERQREESLDNIKSITLSNVINFALFY